MHHGSVIEIVLRMIFARSRRPPMQRFLGVFLGVFACAALCAPSGTQVQDQPAIVRTGHQTLSGADIYRNDAPPRAPTHALRLSLAYFPDAGWSAEATINAARAAAAILGQCGIIISALELNRLAGARRYRYYSTAIARELVQLMPLSRPTVYFVADTLQRPAFDAEAIGRGNSTTRPELADTVWITRATRDLGIALAHELAHVLMDRGDHSEEPGNLMRGDTSPENTRLSAAQCTQLRDTAAGNGLLQQLN